MKEAKFSNLLCCILLLFVNSCIPFTHANDEDGHHEHHQDSAMDFLKPLVGTLKGNSSTLGISKLKKFLSNLGYLNTNTNTNNMESESGSSHSPPHDDLFDEGLEEAIRKYQSFFKLPSTGALDGTTVAHMGQPRCGVPDVFRPNSSVKYTLFPGTPKWPAGRRDLSYSFPMGTPKDVDVSAAIREATNIWAGVAAFKFSYTVEYEKADIKISFQYGAHGDDQAFDGKGGILAHATAPTGGVLHFDGDERWVVGAENGAFDLQTVGLHELGHVLGLAHSADTASIMFPSIPIGTTKGLNKDDIDGIKALYP